MPSVNTGSSNFEVTPLNYSFSLYNNKAGISSRTEKEIFPEEGGRKYLQIKNYVFEVDSAETPFLHPKIFLNAVQRKHCDPNLAWKVDAVPFYPEQSLDRFSEMRQVTFKLSKYDIKKKKFRLELDKLRELFQRVFEGQFFVSGQELLAEYAKGKILKATVIKMHPESREFGRLTANTKTANINFEIENKSDLVIVEKGNSEDFTEFTFEIASIREAEEERSALYPPGQKLPAKDAWKREGDPLPAMISKEELERRLRNLFSGYPARFGRKYTLKFGKWEISFQLTRLKHAKDKKEDLLWEPDKKYTQEFDLLPTHELNFIRRPSEVQITAPPENARIADKAMFEILEHAGDFKTEGNQRLYVSLKELREKISKLEKPVCLDGQIAVNTACGTYLLKFIEASGPIPENWTGEDIRDLWKISGKSDIQILSKSFSVVDDCNAIPLKEVTVKVDLFEAALGRLLNKEVTEKKTSISEKDLEERFRSAAPLYLLDKQRLRAEMPPNLKLVFDIDHCEFEGKEGRKFEHGSLFMITPETKITFISHEEGVVGIDAPLPEMSWSDFERKLKESGIGGMKKKLKKILEKVYLPLVIYKDMTHEIGKRGVNGMIFHGPPGTGKTLFANQMAEILGCHSDNVTTIGADQLKVKWVGDTEKRIRKVFKKAADSGNLHVIFFDEGESLFGDRDNMNQNHERGFVNALLNVLDGAAKKHGKSIENVIFIISTNRFDSLDRALLRPGRMGLHLEFGYPNLEARKEIAEGLMKKFPLEDSFSIDKFAETTGGMSGAEIKQVFEDTFSRMLMRLYETGISPEQAKTDPKAKMTFEDFEEVLRKKLKKKVVPFEYREEEDLKDQIRQYFISQRFLLTKEQVECLEEIYRARELEFDRVCDRNVIPPRALFITGPDGTGKTALAKKLEGLFPKRYKYFKNPHLKEKSRTWKEIEQFVLDARSGAKELRGKSPPYVLVLDGIDPKELKEVVSDLEDLFDHKTRDIHNLLIVAIPKEEKGVVPKIPSHSERYLEMKPFDFKMRKEYLECFVKEEIRSDKLDLDLVAEQTKDYTCSEMQALIALANTRAMQRPGGKFKTKDFLDAIKPKETSPITMYT